MINRFSILNGAKYCFSGISQNYLVFTTAKKNIKYSSGTARILTWKFIGMSEENIPKSEGNFAIIYSESNKSIYFVHTKSTIKKFKHRFYMT